MNAKIYCMASAKGGSGKTILTATFASFLTVIGKKCLIVDCDAATHGLTLLYLHSINKKLHSDPSYRPVGTLDCKPIELTKDIVTVENGVDLIPATYRFELYECISENAFSDALSILLQQARLKYDFIFLDSQAGSDAISHAAMKKGISDEVIIVSEYDPLSAAGVERLKSVFNNDLEFTRTWVLLNKMLPEFVDKFSDFLSVTKYLSPIPWTSDVVRSYSRRRLALDTEYGNEYTLAIMQTLKSLLGDEAEAEINKWAEERAYNIRLPLETQYSDAEMELLSLIGSKKDYAIRRNRRAMIKSFIWSVFPVLLIMTIIIYIRLYKFEIFPFSNFITTSSFSSLITITAVTFSIFTFKSFLGSKTSEEEMEEARYDRQLEVLQERLKKLETLKKADYKTLIKNNK